MITKLVSLTCLILLTVSPILSCHSHEGEVLSENYWIIRKALPRPYWGEAVAVNGKIYFFAWNATYEYDPAVDGWTAKTPMPAQRKGFAVAAYKNRIYVIGGVPVGSSESCWVNEAYNPETDTWERRADMPTKRSNLKAAVVDGKIYLIGGLEKNCSMVPTVSCLNEVYDPERDTWIRASPIPKGVYSYACAVIDNKIYIMAGQDEDPQTPLLLQIYDSKTDTWSTGSSPPVMVASATAAATTGKWASKRIYLIGGRINYSMDGSNIVQVYNIENESWTIGASMPTARYAPAAAVINDTIYVIGGIETFNLHPPFGWIAANEQYIPFGYNTLGLGSSTSPAQEEETSQQDQRSDRQTQTLLTLLVASIVAIALVTTMAIILKKGENAYSRTATYSTRVFRGLQTARWSCEPQK
jgi:N-acetylneuraminic acid mutarotase